MLNLGTSKAPFCEMLQCVVDSKFGRRGLLAMSATISQLKIPNIDISGVAFPPALRTKLLKGGFKMTADFDGMSPSELSRGAAHLAFLLCAKLRNLECEEPIFPDTTPFCVCVCGVLVRVVTEAQIGMHDAAEVLRLVRGDPRPAHKRGRSALELLQVRQLFFSWEHECSGV